MNMNKLQFIENHYLKSEPALLDDFSKSWPCHKKWTYDFLKKKCGNLRVQYNEPIKDKRKSKLIPPVSGKMLFRDYIHLLERNHPSEKRLFLNYSLFKYDKSLEKDIPIPKGWVSNFLLPYRFLFFGVKNSKVRLHYDLDEANVFLTQIKGRKKVWLFHPDNTPYLYKYPFAVHSAVDFFNPDFKKYSLFKQAKAKEVIIHPGQTLYMPSGWWHAIEYIDAGYGVSLRSLPIKIKSMVSGFNGVFFSKNLDNLFNKVMPNVWANYKEKKVALLA